MSKHGDDGSPAYMTIDVLMDGRAFYQSLQ
jgi:hypothetical protein